jgi:ion channel-forming bestrophin family protein
MSSCIAHYLPSNPLSSLSLSENPFQYDEHDLDLDSFCRAIARELSELTAHPAPDPAEFSFTVWNQPFAPGDARNAWTILDDDKHEYHHPTEGMNSIRRTMLRNWKRVHESTSSIKSA